ncbi:hypothetical protein QJS10_CPA08g00648 [Acorus calamus]|uniref:Inhibitor I9 domain-containing protein n=1 Tax=Acorus calamus TaxID=4465 RepID=A0AAV9E9J5_ACOCL|nr:hypothetical protein QJS10_CPA08g00648 [Acorus calamus]
MQRKERELISNVHHERRSATATLKGVVSFLPWGYDDGSVGEGGRRYDIILRGLPLLWQTVEAIRCLVGSFGHLLDVLEAASGDDEFPLIKVGVWMGSGFGPPSLVVGRRGGWKKWWGRIYKTVVFRGIGGSSQKVVEGVSGLGQGVVPKPSKGKGPAVELGPSSSRDAVSSPKLRVVVAGVTSREVRPYTSKAVVGQKVEVTSRYVSMGALLMTAVAVPGLVNSRAFAAHDSWHRSTLSALPPNVHRPVPLYTYEHVIPGFSAHLTQFKLTALEHHQAHHATTRTPPTQARP